MQFVQIDEHSFNQLMVKMTAIEKKLNEFNSEPEELWMDNDQVRSYLNVSKRTLQSYRDKKLIQYSQHGAKIWYKYDWIREFLEKHKKP